MLRQQETPFARRAGSGVTRNYAGHLFSFLADGEGTNGSFALLEVTVRRGFEPPPHTHSHEDETYYVQHGTFTFEVGGEILRAGPGTCVFLPRGVRHAFSVDTNAARALILLTPAGLEQAFIEMSEPTDQTAGLPPVPEGGPPVERMGAVFGARGVSFAPPA
jgi:quercetin dioxygenase-like cupin family protein